MKSGVPRFHWQMLGHDPALKVCLVPSVHFDVELVPETNPGLTRAT